jgi:hypothetical protein
MSLNREQIKIATKNLCNAILKSLDDDESLADLTETLHMLYHKDSGKDSANKQTTPEREHILFPTVDKISIKVPVEITKTSGNDTIIDPCLHEQKLHQMKNRLQQNQQLAVLEMVDRIIVYIKSNNNLYIKSNNNLYCTSKQYTITFDKIKQVWCIVWTAWPNIAMSEQINDGPTASQHIQTFFMMR